MASMFPHAGDGSLVPLSYTGPLPSSTEEQIEVCRVRLRTQSSSVTYDGRSPVESLLLQPNCDVQCVFCAAAELNMVETMESLVEQHGAIIDAYVDMDGEYCTTALQLAALRGAVNALKWLLKHGADPNKLSIASEGVSSIPPLWNAALQGFLRIVRILLEAGADPNCIKSDTGNSALFIACQNNHLTVANELIRWGADPKLTGANDGLPPLMAAVATCHLSLVALLCSVTPEISTKDLMAFLVHMLRTWETPVKDSHLKRKVTPTEIAYLYSMIGPANWNAANILGRHETAGVHYRKFLAAENKGDYRQALRHISLAQTAYQQAEGKPPALTSNLRKNSDAILDFCRDSLKQWAQLLLDEKRLVNAVYGPKACDGRISIWEEHAFDRDDCFPPDLQFYSWSRHGDLIYRYGGKKFIGYDRSGPEDGLWTFNVRSKHWKQVKTHGTSPGPRSNHVSVVYKDALYVLGGNSEHGMASMKLHKLDLKADPPMWSAIRGMGRAPLARAELGACVYKDTLYVYGGENQMIDTSPELNFLGDLWSFDFRKGKWKELSRIGGARRKSHQMWGAGNKLYALGGSKVKLGGGTTDMVSIRSFQSFDLATGQWENLRCVGDDPWAISEFCLLPIYLGQEEPTSIIIFGGYRDMVHAPPMDACREMYGDELLDFLQAYKRRMLRLDLDTMVWTKLNSIRTEDAPYNAQCFAAELSSENGCVKLLIGGGYGIHVQSEEVNEKDKNVLRGLGFSPEEISNMSVKPTPSRKVFEVHVNDSHNSAFLDRAAKGIGWEWELFDHPGEKLPTKSAEMFLGSSTLHTLMPSVACEDFEKPPSGPIVDDDESTNLGRRVILQGLVGSKNLNGSIGRCGPWLPCGRYHVALERRNRNLSVKSTNMRYASRKNPNELAPSPSTGYNSILCTLLKARKTMFADTYRGPLSARGMSLVNYLGKKPPGSDMMTLFLVSTDAMRSNPNHTMGSEAIQKMEYFERFAAVQKATDTARVTEWTDRLLERRDTSKWVDWLKLTVTLDQIEPPVRRELFVSPHVSMAELRHQILCPAVGWTPNLHAWACRRRFARSKREGEDYKKVIRRVARGWKEECWIGPTHSSAIDMMFLPFYIGGAFANDRVILLGDLYFSRDDIDEEVMMLDYIEDLGDWRSHCIKVSAHHERVEGGSVAVLESGTGACPVDNSGGGEEWCELFMQLTGVLPPDSDSEGDAITLLDPSNDGWWELLKSKVYSQKNARLAKNPLEFDIAWHRRKMAEQLLRKLDKKGSEQSEYIQNNFQTGMRSGFLGGEAKFENTVRKPKQFCAECGVTAGLSLCSGCLAVAFCCRQHQLDNWPSHKAACKLARKKSPK